MDNLVQNSLLLIWIVVNFILLLQYQITIKPNKMNTQIKSIINSFETEFDASDIDEASNYAQDVVTEFLASQGEGVEITIEDGDVIVNAPQEVMDAANDYTTFCNDLQYKFNDDFKYHLTQIEARKIINQQQS